MDDRHLDVGKTVGGATMFDLSSAITDWRSEVAARGCCRKDDIDELETHLREEHESLKGVGLSDEEAFCIAARRLGPPDAVCAEYAKSNPGVVWLNRLTWMATGTIAYWALRALASLGSAAVSFGLTARYTQNGYWIGTVNVCAWIALMLAELLLLYQIVARGKWGVSAFVVRTLATRNGRAIFVAVATLAAAGTLVCRKLVEILWYKTYGLESFSQMKLVVGCFGLARAVAIPIVLALLLAYAHSARCRQLASSKG